MFSNCFSSARATSSTMRPCVGSSCSNASGIFLATLLPFRSFRMVSSPSAMRRGSSGIGTPSDSSYRMSARSRSMASRSRLNPRLPRIQAASLSK